MRLSAVFLLALFVTAACGRNAPPSKLAPIAAAPKPVLPPWIVSVSPTQTADALSQIRIVFAHPLVPVQALSGNASQVLSRVRLEPALQGHFTLLTPRMIGFVGDQALPVGTRVSITLESGLADLSGNSLAHDLVWTFQTASLSLSDLPQTRPTGDEEATPAPVGLRPTLAVTANAAVDPSSLAAQSSLVGGGENIAVTAALHAQPTPYPGTNAQELYNPALRTWTYDLRPARGLRMGTTYALRIEPGVEPLYGNLPTDRRFEGSVRTYAALAVVPTPMPSPGSGGRFAGGDPVIAFSNPLDPASVKSAVTLSPAPASVKTLFSVPEYRTDVIAIDPYALDPDSTYTATVAASVKDAFGQQLGSEQRVTIRTGDFAAGAWAPSGTNVFPAGASVSLNFYATNLPANRYQSAVARVKPLQLLGYSSALALLPKYRMWPAHPLREARVNVQSVVHVPLQSALGAPYGALAYGFRTALDAPDADPGLTGIVQITNLGVFTQWFPAHGIVMVQRLNDGTPVRGASVAVYRLDEDGKIPPQQCATGTTGATGELDLYGVDVDRCSAAAPSNQAPNLGVVVTEGADVATVTAWNYGGISRFDVYGGWTSGAPLSRGTIFSDRQMYQPGEHGRITGIAYYVKGEQVVADADASYRVTLTDPSNNAVSLGTARTDHSGIFSMPIDLGQQQALGYYAIDAKGSNGNDLTGSLRVAEFKPPNFKLTLTLDTPAAAAGSSVRANVAAAYLFGAPLQGGTAHAYVTRDLATVQPKGWDDFSFGPQWYWPEETPSFDTDVLQRDLALDSNGTTSLNVAVPRDLPFPMNYRVDMETSDVSNLSVADSKTFLALPADAVIGLASEALGKAGAAMPIRVIVTDANGKPIAGRAVHVELQKMTYVSATQQTEGGENAEQSIKYDTAASADTTSGDVPVTVNLTPADTGPYRVLANFGHAPSAATASSIQIFAFGPSEADWGMSDPNAVAVKLDKKQYAVGETATALVGSPYSRADIYFAVVRNDTIYRTVLRGTSGAVRVNFKVTPEMLPNAAVQAVVIRRAAGSANASTLALTGLTALNVDLSGRYLKLAIAAQNATVHPAGRQHIAFTVSRQNGTPVRGEIVAMVVNDAILQLSGYRLPDLVQTIFAQQPIATIFADNRENVTLKTLTAPLEKGFGYGGGFLAGAASTRVRANFVPLPYYGILRTDAGGHASADFAMPDDLTTWRIMAVAIAENRSQFATADATFVSNQPLIVNPLLPQFARPGDRFGLGLSVANQTGAAGALNFVLMLTGALAFEPDGSQTQRGTENVSAGVQAYRLPVVVGSTGSASVQASAKLGSYSDAFRVPFSPSNRDSTDSVIDSGATRTGAAIPLALNNGGTLTVTLANSVVPQFVTPSERVMAGDAFPLTDDVASRLVIASALQRLSGPYHLKLSFDPRASGSASVAQLLSLQRSDGGFGGFRGDNESDPFATAAALDAMNFARAHGIAIEPAAMRNAAGFMARALANPGLFKWCASDAACKARLRFDALWSLAGQGPVRTDFLSDIVARSGDFDSATQIRLARYLLRAPGWRTKGSAMAERLESTLYVTGRYAVANAATRWSWVGSRVDAQAQMLALLIERHAAAEQVAGAVRALVAQQCRCGWPTTDDTAAAVAALSAYAATEHLGPATAALAVGTRGLGTAKFGSTASSQTFTAAASSVAANAALRVTTSGGLVHYLVMYTYPVPANAPGELAAFRVVRTLTDPSAATSSRSAAPLVTMDLATALPASVAAGRVFDVGVRAIVDHPVDRLIIDDPLPAGFEAVDTALRTSLQAIVPQSNSWQIDASQLYRDRVLAYAQHLEPGVYDLHYLVRSVTPGTFAWPGSRVYLKDAPEEFGRSAGTTLKIVP